MISIRKYLDDTNAPRESAVPAFRSDRKGATMVSVCLDAYRAVLAGMGRASLEACPGLGNTLDKTLASISESMSGLPSPETIALAGQSVQAEIENWGRSTARHYQQKAGEVKEMLLVMAKTAESVGDRDQRCAQQFNDVTTTLRSIASLDDISQIRNSIRKSTTDLKGSIDRMTSEGKAVVHRLRSQVTLFEARLAEAEKISSSDALTGLRSRLSMEGQIDHRIAHGRLFCLALLDLDGFKAVNDEFGHLSGDEVLKQFAAELKSACRSTDLVGRWGGDEFVILLDCDLPQAKAQMERVRKWVCGSYSINWNAGALKVPVRSSVGLAEALAGESMSHLMERADIEMYADKTNGSTAEERKRP